MTLFVYYDDFKGFSAKNIKSSYENDLSAENPSNNQITHFYRVFCNLGENLQRR